MRSPLRNARLDACVWGVLRDTGYVELGTGFPELRRIECGARGLRRVGVNGDTSCGVLVESPPSMGSAVLVTDVANGEREVLSL